MTLKSILLTASLLLTAANSIADQAAKAILEPAVKASSTIQPTEGGKYKAFDQLKGIIDLGGAHSKQKAAEKYLTDPATLPRPSAESEQKEPAESAEPVPKIYRQNPCNIAPSMPGC
jgi:hypothetical protein